MSKARKSSIDSGRRALKAHIPYRADDLTHGKKTGVNVREVDRRSDGFESFGEVLTQADVVTPPHMRARRRTISRRSPSPMTEYDENGEMSMELDDTNMDSPNVYFNNAPRPSAPSSANRSVASSHPANRSSHVDYDRVPSPRASSSQRLRPQTNGNTTITPSRFRSNLSQQTVIPSSPEDDDDDDDNGFGDSFGDMPNGNDYDPPAPDDSSSPTRRTSFTAMDQDDDDPLVPDDPRISSPPPRRIDKGKQRERLTDEREEDEIAQGLDEVENDEQMETDGETGTGKNRSQSQKKRGRDERPPKEKKAQAKRKKVQMLLPPSESNIVDGVRRGSRTRYKPLDWWRCEKVVYGRRDSGVSMVPVIKDIVRLPKEIPEPFGVANKRRSSKPRSRSKMTADDNDEEREVVVFNPEEGWDNQTDPIGIVTDYGGGDEVSRRLAFTANMMAPRPAANDDFLYQKIFGDGEFIAAGQLILPVGGKKPSKGTKDNTYVFYLIEGAVNLKIHRTSFVLATGAMFLIPRGNTYYIENIAQRPTRLFFAQARKVNAEEELPTEIVRGQPGSVGSVRTKSIDGAGSRRPSGNSAKSGSVGRSSSAAATSSPDKVVERKRSVKRAVSK
ncbi:Mif2/CENP-C like-domain-containing protein [Phellopilus nigrolimitatus]|nr:Mif2/CENP-C like-domain-containing protein [Phellopilus nigrolimitatus]